MRNTVSKKSKWQSTTIFLFVLASAAVLIASFASGCGPNDVTAHFCPDGGVPDGGDAGDGGAGGSDPFCN
jgi:hypothetical protein